MRLFAALLGMTALLAVPAKADELQTARELLRQENYREAEGALRQAVQNPNLAPEANYLWYQSLRARGEPDRAVRKLALAAELAEGRADWRLESGLYLTELGRYDEAMEEYVRALTVDPSFAAAHAALARAFLQKGMKGAAEMQLRQAVRTDPRAQGNWALLAELLTDRGVPLEALRTAQDGLARSPDSVILTRALAEVYENLRETSKALETYERLAQLAPTDARAQLSIGRLYRLAGDHKKSLAALRKAAALAPGDPDPHVEIAWVYAEQPKRAALAQRSAERALRLKPDYAEAVAAKGWALHKLGQEQEAIELLTAAATKAPEMPASPAAMYHLGLIAKSRDNSEEAAKWFRQVLATDPGGALAARAQELIGQIERSGTPPPDTPEAKPTEEPQPTPSE